MVLGFSLPTVKEGTSPRFYERTLKRIKIEQRRLSRKKKGSKNWEKQRRKFAKRYEKL